jgi:hypothetical protein
MRYFVRNVRVPIGEDSGRLLEERVEVRPGNLRGLGDVVENVVPSKSSCKCQSSVGERRLRAYP